MKNLLFFISIILILSSCKKEEPYNPDEHITYKHWYKLSGSVDTLFSVYIPNAFTPNGDGINDEYCAEGYFILDHFRIYNRLGKVIYETTDRNKKWNGKQNNSGNTVSEGTYTYQIMVKDSVGDRYEYYEVVMLYK